MNQDTPPPAASDQLSQVLLATAVDGIIFTDMHGIVLIYSALCEQMFGYTPEEVIGRNVGLLMPASGRDAHDGYMARYQETGEKHILGRWREVLGRRKDGSHFPVGLAVSEGVRLGERVVVGRLRDLTESKQDAARQEGSNRLLAQLVQSSDDAIISKTLDGVITSWNSAAERIFGYSAPEAVGQQISILFPPHLLAEEARILAQLRRGDDIQHYETVRRHKNGGEVFISLSVSPIRDGAGNVIGASKIARDIGERKRAEARTLALQSELAHVARLSAMGHMSAAIAHELNQPLTAIMNYVKAAQRLLDPASLTPERQETARGAMEKAAAQTLRAGAIIRSLREFVEKRQSEKKPENINAVIEEAIALAFVGAQSNVKLNLSLAPGLPSVTMDKIQIGQVLVNLIRNAIEAMAEILPRELTLSSKRDGTEFVLVTVRDSGPGLPPDVLKKLFQPFVTTKEKGMGIGLNICQSIVEAHGGRIRAVPGMHPGAMFEICLPFAQAPENGLGDEAPP
jgi:two-component system sensor kinase FixL